MKEKKKKPKVVYVDDGRTVYDMSGVVRPGQVIFPENKDVTDKKDKKKNYHEDSSIDYSSSSLTG